MPSTSGPSDVSVQPDAWRAWHYDGRNANRWPVRVVAAEGGFRLIGEGWESGPHSWSDLVALPGPEDRAVFGLSGEDGWRLGFDGPIPAAIAARLPAAPRYGGVFDRFGLPRAAAVSAVIAALVVLVGLRAPGWIAPYIPFSWERRLGDAMVGDFGQRLCRAPAGSAALRRLVGRLDARGDARVVEVANIPIVNAVTLPGGRIILFDGLLRQAGSADEVAGVLGHELGHVRHRDTMTALVRQLGLSVVLGGLSGNVGGYLNTLLSLGYGREAERAADAEAIGRLKAANISPAATAAFFRRMGRGEPGGKAGAAMSWVSSHPLSDERRALFADSVVADHRYTPALDSRDWAALRSICADDPDAKPFLPFSFR